MEMKYIGRFVLMFFVAVLSSCGPLFDRFTVIHGHVLDENLSPMDSVRVKAFGKTLTERVELRSAYTDKTGYYEISLDVPNKYMGLDILIPQYQRKKASWTDFGHFKMYINGKDNSCCHSLIGKKTIYDFEAMSK